MLNIFPKAVHVKARANDSARYNAIASISKIINIGLICDIIWKAADECATQVKLELKECELYTDAHKKIFKDPSNKYNNLYFLKEMFNENGYQFTIDEENATITLIWGF